MPANSIHLHRCPPDRLYRAFLDPDVRAKWLPPHGFTGKVHAHDSRVGGGYRMSFTNFTIGRTHFFGANHIEFATNEMIRYADRLRDPNLPDQVTVTFKPVLNGTGLTIVQEGIPEAILVEMCYMGW